MTPDLSSSSSAPQQAVISLLMEQLQVMRWQEVHNYHTTDYLGCYSPLLIPAQPGEPITPWSVAWIPTICKQWREVICEWAYKLVDHYDCPRDIVGVATHFVDRYLCVITTNSRRRLSGTHCLSLTNTGTTIPQEPSMSKREFKLVSLTCLYIALKMERPSLISIETLLSLSRNIFTRDQVVAMEQTVLHALQWRLHPPTASAFVGYYHAALQLQCSTPNTGASGPLPFEDDKTSFDTLETAHFLVELSVMDYYFVQHRPSHAALGALWCAMEEEVAQQQQHQHPSSNLACLHQKRAALLAFVDSNSTENELSLIWACKTRLQTIHGSFTSSPSIIIPTVPASHHQEEGETHLYHHHHHHQQQQQQQHYQEDSLSYYYPYPASESFPMGNIVGGLGPCHDESNARAVHDGALSSSLSLPLSSAASSTAANIGGRANNTMMNHATPDSSSGDGMISPVQVLLVVLDDNNNKVGIFK